MQQFFDFLLKAFLIFFIFSSFACTNVKHRKIHHTRFNASDFDSKNFLYDTIRISVFKKGYDGSINIYDDTEYNSLEHKLHFIKEDGPPHHFLLNNFENSIDTLYYESNSNYYIIYSFDSINATLNRTSYYKEKIISKGTYNIDSSFFYTERIYNNINGAWLDSLHLMKAVKATRHGEWFYFDSSGNIETTKKYYFGKILK